jgi:DNA-directed RNA polymerase specialized sigma subunit
MEDGMTKSETPAKVRRAIQTLTATHGHAPSLTEIAKVVGVSRTRAFQAALEEERAGRVAHIPRVHRSWRVIGEV